MNIHYLLYPNKLTEDPGDYIARVRVAGAADLDKVIDRMINQEGSIAVRADVLSTMEDFFHAVEDLLVEGYTVRTPVANFRLGVKGTFDGAGDSFDPKRHRIVAKANIGLRLRKAVPPRIEMAKGHGSLYIPRPEEYSDAASGSVNDILTPGGIGKVRGNLLRFDPADPLQGVFFRDTNGGGETRVEACGEVLPGSLHLIVPGLAAGSYKLVVRTLLNCDGEIHSGMLKEVLTVA